MKTMVMGVFYPAAMQDVQASISSRFGSVESRQDWFEARASEKPAGVLKAAAFVSDRFGGLKVTFRYNVKAGCTMCPCSPGFDLIALPETPEQVLRLEGWRDGQGHRDKDERFMFWEETTQIKVREGLVDLTPIQK